MDDADGVVGHFQLGRGGRGDVELLPHATQLVVIEAKLGSGLSSGVKNAPAFNQAARNVACICHLVERSGRQINEGWHLGFYVLAPQSQIAKGVFGVYLDLEGPSGIKAVVADRVKTFAPALDEWHTEHFLQTLARVRITELSWENVIEDIRRADAPAADELASFYESCLLHNRLLPAPKAEAHR